jgi:hypothetical protein
MSGLEDLKEGEVKLKMVEQQFVDGVAVAAVDTDTDDVLQNVLLVEHTPMDKQA